METCDTCCFALIGGQCSMGVCGAKRCELIAKGFPIPPGGCVIAGPERMTPDGLIGFRVGAYEYSPTLDGYRQAKAQQERLNQYRVTDIEPVARYDRELFPGPVRVWNGEELEVVNLWITPKEMTA